MNPKVFFKLIAIPNNARRIHSKTTAPIEYSVLVNRGQNTENYKLKITYSDGTHNLYDAPKAKSMQTIAGITTEMADNNHSEEIPLPKFNYSSPTIAPLLILCMSDSYNLSVLNISELLALSRIETYLGLENQTQFWQHYGFPNADIALQTLKTALDYHNQTATKALDEAKLQSQKLDPSCVNYALADVLKEAFQLSDFPLEHLLELRFEASKSALIPFVYAELADRLRGIEKDITTLSDEQTILNRRNLTIEQKAVHLFWLYMTINLLLIPEDICIKFTAILNSTYSDKNKQASLAGLYRASEHLLTDELIASESTKIITSGMSRWARSVAFEALYTAGAAKLTPERIALERTKILASMMDDFDKIEAFQALYTAVAATLTPEFIASEQNAIRASGINDWEKSQAVATLYRAGAEKLTPFLIDIEHNAIRASGMIDDVKFDAVARLYTVGAAKLTLELITSERTAILASRLHDYGKALKLEKLYTVVAATLTPELIAIEYNVIRESGMDDEAKSKAVCCLFTAGAGRLTPELIAIERNAILNSRMDDYYKSAAVQALYTAVAAKLTPEGIASERTEILASQMRDLNKSTAVQALYRAGAEMLTPARIASEHTAIQESDLPHIEKFILNLALDRIVATFGRLVQADDIPLLDICGDDLIRGLDRLRLNSIDSINRSVWYLQNNRGAIIGNLTSIRPLLEHLYKEAHRIENPVTKARVKEALRGLDRTLEGSNSFFRF